MKHIEIARSGLVVPNIAIGCMRIWQLNEQSASRLISFAIERGANFFDHADIYGKGECEQIFSKALKQGAINRDKVIIQTKCGINQGAYDSSREHILFSVDQSLKRLDTDYIDILLLHRPDALIQPEEVSKAFNQLKEQGKVKYFGVSNYNSLQIELLKKYVKEPLIINQMQLSLAHSTMISSGMNVNTNFDAAIMRDGAVLDYCRINDITIQAWSPLQYGFFEGAFINSDKYKELNKELNIIAEEYSVTPSAIAIAWLLTHPANIQPIIGSTNHIHLDELLQASDINLTRQQWYKLYISAGNKLL